MSTIFKKNTHDEIGHFSLRKLTTGVASVLIGMTFVKNISESEFKVDADTLDINETDQNSEVDSQQGDKFVKLGRIIPVDQKSVTIKGAPTPQYKRDPQDPSKAIATPVPKVDGYKVSTKGQVDNYDEDSQMVTPPADPSQNTYLIYELAHKKEIQPQENSTQRNPNQVNQNKKSGANHSTESRQMKTRLFGFGKKKKEKDKNKNVSENNSDVVSSDANINNNESTATVEQSANTNSNQAQSVTDDKKVNTEQAQSTGQVEVHSVSNSDTESGKSNPSSKEASKNDEGKNNSSTVKDSKNNSTKTKPHHKKTRLKITFETPKAITNKETKIPPKPSVATLQLIDADENDKLITKLSVEGQPGTPIEFNNLIQVLQIYKYNGYRFDNLKNATENKLLDIQNINEINFGFFNEEDTIFAFAMKHRLAKANINSYLNKDDKEEVRKVVYLTIHYQGADSKTPEDNIQKAEWTRDRTIDLVTKRIVPNGEFDTNWHASQNYYEAVKTPEITGYQPDILSVNPIPVTMKSLTRFVTYNPIAAAQQKSLPSQAPKVAPVQPTQTVEADISKKEEKKSVSLTVKFVGAGEATPKPEIQTVNWHRTLTIDQNGQVIDGGKFDTEWLPEEYTFNRVKVPVVNGYHADRIEINRQEVTQEDKEVVVTYLPNGKFIPVDEHNQVLGNAVAFATDPDDPTKAKEDQLVPTIAGYQPIIKKITPPNLALDLHITYQTAASATTPVASQPTIPSKPETEKETEPEIEYSLVDIEHPNSAVSSDQYQKVVSLTVNYTGAGEKTPQSTQEVVNLHRSITVDNNGQIVKDGKFTTDWQADKEDFQTVYVPVIEGYHADLAEVDKKVASENIEVTVNYQRNGKIIPVDEQGNVIGEAKYYKTSDDDPTKIEVDQPVPEIEDYQPVINTITSPDPNIDIHINYRKATATQPTQQPTQVVQQTEPTQPVAVTQVTEPTQITEVSQPTEASEPQVEFTLVDKEHPNNAVDPSEYEKQVKLTVTFLGADEHTPQAKVQTAKWYRIVTIDNQGNIVPDGEYTTEWRTDEDQFETVKVPVVNGYHADQSMINRNVTQEDQTVNVTYQENGHIIPVNETGNVIGPVKRYTTDPTDPTKVAKDQKLPEIDGYHLDIQTVTPPTPDKDIHISYEKNEPKFRVVNADHPNENVPVNKYKKQVKFVVEFIGADEYTPDAVTQTADWTRSLTIDEGNNLVANGKFDTDWQATPDHFDSVKVPVVAGYHTYEKTVTAEKVTLEDQLKQIPYFENASLHFINADGDEISKPIQYKTSTDDPTEAVAISLPTIDGYETDEKSFIPDNLDEDQQIIYHKQVKPAPEINKVVQKENPDSFVETAFAGENKVVAVQTIHFVDEFGNSIYDDFHSQVTFTKDANGEWDQKVAAFSNVTVPIVLGYFADRKAVKGTAIMPDDKNLNPEITVKFHKMGQIIPVDLEGNMISESSSNDKLIIKTFVNDPNDATKALAHQKVPNIEGWQPTVAAVSPLNPAINIPVVYQESDN